MVKRRSKGVLCKPLKGELCTLFNGGPSVRSVKCKRCAEYRCAQHCRCGRRGMATGRNAPRNQQAVTERALQRAATNTQRLSVQLPVQVPQRENCSLLPTGTPSPVFWQDLKSKEWWRLLLEKLDTAREADLATFLFRHSWRFFAVTGTLPREKNNGFFSQKNETTF